MPKAHNGKRDRGGLVRLERDTGRYSIQADILGTQTGLNGPSVDVLARSYCTRRQTPSRAAGATW